MTNEDMAEALGECELPLQVPNGFKIVTLAPAVAKLDPTDKASDELLNMRILLRFKDYGWCVGTITSKVTNRSRRIGRDRVNFVAKFDMDEGETTDLSLEANMYDVSPSADYQSWMLLEPEQPE